MSETLDWRAQLQPASWRGLPFLVQGETVRSGRRLALHEYPFKDDVWPEDLGRLPRAFAIEGFVVGDDCAAQRRALQDAAEAAGTGELVHPTFGRVTVSLASFTSAARQDLGRACELRFEFIRGQAQQFPAISADTAGQVASAMANATSACDSDFVNAAGGSSFLGSVSAAISGAREGVGNAIAATGIPDAIHAVQGYVAKAQSIVGDATTAFNSVRGLVPISAGGRTSSAATFGRFAAGSRITPLAGIGTVSAAIASANQARSAVTSACTNVQQLVANL
jgi:prophage DNA circulation protein